MIWYDVMKRLEDCGLNPVEETYMENYGKILTAQRPEFRELLLSQCGAGGQVDTRKLGQWLKRISGRLYGGHRIVPGRADKHDKVQRWMLTNAQDAGIAG